ncbi:MAG: CstA-like transporter-associated (seleno)protein [Nevskiales bacterium]
MNTRFRQIWRWLRQLSGDDAYERYLVHWRVRHAKEGAPLDRKAFYRAELTRKWSGVRRCC